MMTLLAAMPLGLVWGQLTNLSKKKLNDLFAARVEFSDMDVCLFRNLSHSRLVLKDFQMIGSGAFEGDTILSCKKATIRFSLASLIGRKHIKIKSILLEQPRFYAHVLEDGQPNWKHIMKPKEAAPQPAVIAKPQADLKSKPKPRPKTKVSIQQIEIRKAGFAYADETRKLASSAEAIDLLLVNEKAAEDTTVWWRLSLQMDGVDLRMGEMYLMRHAHIGLVSEIISNPKGWTLLRLKDSRLRLNEMGINLDGTLSTNGQDKTADFSFRIEDEGFKSLLSLIPPIYAEEHFDSLQTRGNFLLEGSVKGSLGKEQKPSIGLRLKVDSAMFSYPHLPDSAKHIHLAMDFLSGGADAGGTTLNIDSLHFEPAGEPFDMKLHIQTPPEDVWIAGAMKGTIRFDSLARLIPLHRTKLSGYLSCDLSLSGFLSALEKEPYENFRSEGMLELNGVNLTNARFPQGIDVPNFSVKLTPRTLKLLRSFLYK
jgi:hypothetical protein